MERGQRRGPETDPGERGRLKRLQREVGKIVESDAFVDAIVESHRDEKARAALKANPKAHLKGKGVVFPDEVDVKVTEESPWCIVVCFTWWVFTWCVWICS